MADILLAFGTHGSRGEKPDRRFFRREVSSFIEAAAANGRRVAIIHEFSVYGDIRVDEEERSLLMHRGSLEGLQHPLRGHLAALQDQANAGLRRTLDLGLPGEPIEDWGFNDRIREINARRPGSVLSVVEPQSLESLVAHWRIADLGGGIQPDGVGHMMGFIRTMAEDCARRDRRVAGMIERTAALDGDAAIAVPRGSGHRGMRAMLAGTAHEVRVVERLACEDWMDRAVRASYSRTLSDEELRACAVLELELLRFVHSRMGSAAARAACALGAGRWLRGRLFQEGMEMLEKEIAGGRFELPVPGL